MAGLVGLHDAQGAVVWINPSWVKIVRDVEGGSSMVEFMDGERMPLSHSARFVMKRLNGSLAPKPPAPVVEAPKAASPDVETPQSGGGVRNLLRKVALEA